MSRLSTVRRAPKRSPLEPVRKSLVPTVPRTIEELVRQIQFVRNNPYVAKEDMDMMLDDYLEEILEKIKQKEKISKNIEYLRDKKKDVESETVVVAAKPRFRWDDHFFCCFFPYPTTVTTVTGKTIKAIYLIGVYGCFLLALFIFAIWLIYFR